MVSSRACKVWLFFFKPIVVFAFYGCLPPDTGLDIGTQKDREKVSVSSLKTTAPLVLAPQIILERSFGEAPKLAEQVRQSELLPVSERLPQNPLVVVPLSELGTYGGDIRRALTGDIAQWPGVSKTLNENLMGYERPMPHRILYNLAESHRFLEDGKIAVFKIRKGIKWSDGVPFTVDDILFWYYDVMSNEDARPNSSFPSSWLVEGKPIRIKKLDDHTVQFMSHKPMGRILNLLCRDEIAMPKHYFSHFHPKYNTAASYEDMRDRASMAKRLYTPGVPTLSAWMPVQWERGQRVVFERNPFYFKVDSAGNQLPYADRLVFTVIPDTEVILLKFINGELDLLGRYAQISMFPMLKAEEPKGKFKVMLGTPVPASALRLNWDTPNLPLQRAFRNKQVRMALSYAINREEISEILYHGLLQPAGYSFAPASQYYSETMAQTYAQYLPQKAKALLDVAGYVDTDGDGVRELDDGSPFSLVIDVIPSMGVDVCELIQEHWTAIGIAVDLNIALRDILFPRRASGDFEVYWWWSMSGDAVVKRQDWGIVGPNQPLWHRKAGQEGPKWLWEATRLIEEAGATVDTALVRAKMERVRDLHTEHVPSLLPGFAYHVWGASTRLGNVPTQATTEDGYRGWSRPIFHEQLFIRSGN